MTDMRINRAHGVDLEDLDIVVVDDSKPMQTIVRSMLNAARVHRVRTFDNAGDAYRAMLVEPPHILITDWNLPDSDGVSLVRSMRDPRSGPLVAVPAILITGHATRKLVETAIAAGIHFVLAKPLSPSNVIKRIQALRVDERRFVQDPVKGQTQLEGTEALLAGQRQRWHDLHEGTPRRLPERAAAPARPRAPQPAQAPAPTPIAAAAATPARLSPAQEAARRRRSLGLGAPVRSGPVETSTGQPPTHAS